MKEFFYVCIMHSIGNMQFYIDISCSSMHFISFFNHDNPYWSDIGKAKFDQSLACNSFKTTVKTASVAD